MPNKNLNQIVRSLPFVNYKTVLARLMDDAIAEAERVNSIGGTVSTAMPVAVVMAGEVLAMVDLAERYDVLVGTLGKLGIVVAYT